MTALPDFDSRWNFDDPAATRQTFRALLEEHGAEADATWRLCLLTQLARTHSLARELDAAHALLDEVETQLGAAEPLARLRYLLERGRTFNSAGEKARARELFEQAWGLGRQLGAEGLAVDAAHMVAIVASGEDAMSWNLLALELARASEQPAARKWLGSLYNNIGWTYHDGGQYEKALELFREAQALREREGPPQRLRVAKWCVARALRSLGRLEEALGLQQALAAEHAGAGTRDGYVAEEIAECLLALGREDEARPHFGRAHEVLSEDAWLAANEPQRLERLARLGGQSSGPAGVNV